MTTLLLDEMKPIARLGWLEEAALVVILAHGDPSSARKIRETLENRLQYDEKISIAALYAALERLEDKGLIKSLEQGPNGKPGGRSRRVFKVTPHGQTFIFSTKKKNDRLWKGVDIQGELAVAGATRQGG